jgi:hypothetical protein
MQAVYSIHYVLFFNVFDISKSNGLISISLYKTRPVRTGN